MPPGSLFLSIEPVEYEDIESICARAPARGHLSQESRCLFDILSREYSPLATPLFMWRIEYLAVPLMCVLHIYLYISGAKAGAIFE
jgi:hypothetical protein